MITKYIIGIDQALRNTAVTVFDNTGRMLEFFNITTKAGTPTHICVDYIIDQFFERLAKYMTPELLRTHSTAFFIEDIKYTRAGDKTHARAEVAGVLKWLIRQDGWNVYGIDPGAANSFLDARFGIPTPKRKRKSDGPNGQKAHTMDVLHRYCNFYTRNDNIADSYVMGLFGYAYLIEKQRLSITPLCKVKF